MENKEEMSVAVRAMSDMIRFLSLAEKDWYNAAKEWQEEEEEFASCIAKGKSDAFHFARMQAESLLHWIFQEESK